LVDLVHEMDTRLTDSGIMQEHIVSAMADAWALRYQDIRRAIALVSELSSKIDPKHVDDRGLLKALADLHFNLGSFHFQVGEYEPALAALQTALYLYNKAERPRDVILTHAALSRVHIQLSNYVQALEHTLEGFELFSAKPDKELEAVLLYDLGSIYIQRDDCSRALPYLLKSLQLAQDASLLDIQAVVLERISCAYTRLGDPQAGLDAAKRCLEIFQANGDHQGEAAALNSLGQAYQALEDYPSAQQCYQQAEKTANTIEMRFEVLRSMVLTASLHNQRGELERSVDILEAALQLAQEIQSTAFIIEIHHHLSDNYRRLQNFQKALYHYEQFHLSNEQVINAENESKIGSMEVIFQVEAARRAAEEEQQKNILLEQEINERINVEKALQAANEQLQMEIQEREALIADLDAFARMVAHDLKTPLQNLSLLSYLLHRELTNYENAESPLELVEEIQQTGLKAGAIINELLTLASLRSTDIELTPLDMKAVVDEAINRMKLLIEERKARITVAAEIPQVQGHAPWIVEAVANLISNAIKYGGEPPVIEIGSDPPQDGFIRIWVKDNGNGISPRDQAKLFQDFSRLGRQTGGHGLGLSITRRIITKLSGKVGVDSSGKKGEGAIFWFTLPCAMQAEDREDG